VEISVVDTRDKIISYRRAEWLPDAVALTLEGCLRESYVKLTTVSERTIIREGRCARTAKVIEAPNGGLLLHITVETPGEAASVVPKVTPNIAALNLTIAGAPAGGEWLDGDAFLYVLGDHVCICTTAVYDRAIRIFLWELFAKASLRPSATHFDLMKVADISKVKMLHTQGVKELEIRATLYQASADYARRKAHTMSSVGAAAKHLKAILQTPDDCTPDGLRVCLTLKTDARFRKGLALGEKRIEQLAADVVENSESNDDYVIITKTGQRISPNEIFMKTTVPIEVDGKTVNRDKAWKELVSFFKSMKESGVLGQ